MIKGSVDFGNIRENFAKLAGPGKESLARRMGVAAGRIFRDDARINAPVGKSEQQAMAQYGGSLTPGLLKSAIYVAFNKKQTTSTSFVYSVSWNHSIAPHGHWLEFGRWQRYVVFFSVRRQRWLTDKSTPLPGGPKWIRGYGFLAQAYHSGKTRAFIEATDAGRREFPKILSGETE